jgi:hypothetical protein
MSHVVLNALTRRASLMALGTAGLATLAHPITSDAKKKGKKKRNKGDVFKLCKKQVGQCIDVLTPECNGDPECLATVDRCCQLLSQCDLDGNLDCLAAAD